jgi:RNA processing factor Prp31
MSRLHKSKRIKVLKIDYIDTYYIFYVNVLLNLNDVTEELIERLREIYVMWVLYKIRELYI